MKQCNYLSWLVGGIALSCLTMTRPIQAQIAPDATLPNKSSVTTQGNTKTINGGTRAGGNLFHSFEQFSVPTGGRAFFNNTQDIQNIISRVTGESVSEIDGTLGANGAANLFLLNPNGIIFGRNASLDIGGSFLASTASSLNFADNTQFSATDPQATPLLTVSVPVGLQFGATPGSIRNQSQASPNGAVNVFGLPVGLQVQPGKTLALVGSNIALEGGNLTAEGGRIELGSVAGTGLINLNTTDNGWTLGYEGVQIFQDIQLSQQAAVDASGNRGGDIQVQGRRITLTDGSAIGAVTVGSEPGGTLTVTASESVELVGISSDVFNGGLVAGTFSTEAAGDLRIQTGQLIVRDGAQVSASTFGEGQGGDLTVNASESVELVGISSDGLTSSSLSAQTRGSGDAGDLTIETGRLLIRDGARVTASTFGAGQGGDLTVRNAAEVELVGGIVVDGGFTPSGLFAQTIGSGDVGDLTIETGRLLIQGGAQVSASTFGEGQGGDLTVNASESVELVDVGREPDGKPLTDQFGKPSFFSGLFTQTDSQAGGAGAAGDLKITTQQLIIRDGAQVNATTFGAGNAGDLKVRATAVELVGAAVSADSELLKSKNDLPFSSGLFAGTEENSVGKGGIVDVETDRLSLRDGAVLQTSTLGAGDAGNLTVEASESVELIGTAKGNPFPTSLIALSGGFPDLGLGVPEATGRGGNLDLNIKTGQLLVQDGAEIAVSSINRTSAAKGAGSIKVTAPTISLDNGDIRAKTASGNGGNIGIQVPNLLLLRNNSNISTSAGSARVDGDGGNIEIDTNSIVAIPQENSDITANAFSGSGGNVEIEVQGDIFGLEPLSRQELQNLLEPDDPLDPIRLPSNDITAISQTNPSLNGVVNINTPDVDPSEGVVALPDVPVNVAVTQGCQATGSKLASVEFLNTGKGGLAPSPYEPLSGNVTWEDVPQGTKNLAGAPRASASANPPNKIVEAQGWLINEKGEAVLVAEVPTSRSQRRCRLR